MLFTWSIRSLPVSFFYGGEEGKWIPLLPLLFPVSLHPRTVQLPFLVGDLQRLAQHHHRHPAPDVVRILVRVLGDFLDELHSGDVVAVYRRGLEAENAIGCIPRDLDQVFVVAPDVHEELRLEAQLLGGLDDDSSRRGGGPAPPSSFP